MTLMMGSEMAGLTSPFEVSLVFSPVKLSRAGRFSRRTVLVLGWAYGVLSAGTPPPQKRQVKSPFPRAGASWGHPVLVAMVTTPPC